MTDIDKRIALIESKLPNTYSGEYLWLISQLKSERAKVEHLRDALATLVKNQPCTGGACHCPVCCAKHALSATGGCK